MLDLFRSLCRQSLKSSGDDDVGESSSYSGLIPVEDLRGIGITVSKLEPVINESPLYDGSDSPPGGFQKTSSTGRTGTLINWMQSKGTMQSKSAASLSGTKRQRTEREMMQTPTTSLESSRVIMSSPSDRSRYPGSTGACDGLDIDIDDESRLQHDYRGTDGGGNGVGGVRGEVLLILNVMF